MFTLFHKTTAATITRQLASTPLSSKSMASLWRSLRSQQPAEKMQRSISSWQGALCPCDCFKKSECTAPPFPKSWLKVDDDNLLSLDEEHRHHTPTVLQMQHWMKTACRHPEMTTSPLSFSSMSFMALQKWLYEIPVVVDKSQNRPAHLVALDIIGQGLMQQGLCISELRPFTDALSNLLNAIATDHISIDAPKAYFALLDDKPVAMLQNAPIPFLVNANCEIGLCELGIFVARKSTSNTLYQTIFSGKSLTLEMPPVTTTSPAFICKNFPLLGEFHLSSTLASSRSFNEDIRMLTQKRESVHEAAVPILCELQQAALFALSAQQPLMWVS